MEDGCPFCEIAAGEGDAHELYRTDAAVSFLDKNPAVEGHTLVIPTDHCEDILTADDRIRQPVFDAAGDVADALDRALDPDGFSLFHTSGPLVGSVTHAHVHVVPRTDDDGIGLALNRDDLDAERADALVKRIQSND